MAEQIGSVTAMALLQAVMLLLLAPLIQGIIKKVKARLQNRIGPSVWQPYYDLIKYFKKDAVISDHASWLTVATPYVVFAAVLTAGLFVPTFIAAAPLGFMGDFILVVYLFGAARFFTALTALDGGGAFGGMGSSREMALSAIAEPALLLSAIAVLLTGGTVKLDQLVQTLASQGWSWTEPAYVLAFIAMLMIVITETGRIPVDNPDTHLELTMIHEGMLLEYSGRYLGLMMWTAQIKQLLVLTLFIDFFLPWGLAMSGNGAAVFLSLVFYLIKLVALGILLAFIETFYAKIRLFKVPKLLTASMVLSLLAILAGSFA
jgi:formate hydrogenlyase subunit 4